MDPVENGDNAAAGVGVMMMMPITVPIMEIQSGGKKKTIGKQRRGEDNLALKLRTRFPRDKQQPHPFCFKIHWDEEPFLCFLFPFFKKLIQGDFVVEIYKTRGAVLLLR